MRAFKRVPQAVAQHLMPEDALVTFFVFGGSEREGCDERICCVVIMLRFWEVLDSHIAYHDLYHHCGVDELS
jgi:hypothetical protein